MSDAPRTSEHAAAAPDKKGDDAPTTSSADKGQASETSAAPSKRAKEAESSVTTSKQDRAEQAPADQESERPLEMRTSPLPPPPEPTDRRYMPDSFDISLATSYPADIRLVETGPRERRQPMAGFEDTFTDIVDFILRATHRIWDEKAIGYLYEHYRSNTRVIDDAGVVYGRDQVIANSVQMMAAFPDCRFFADEVLWCGDEDQGFWVSHRATMVGHNKGWTKWGPPTGRRVAITCIANTYSHRNQISDEYVVYNTGSLLKQLGYDLMEAAAVERASRPKQETAITPTSGGAQRLHGQGRPTRPYVAFSPDFDESRSLRATLDAIWNWRMLDRVDQAFSGSLRFNGPTDRVIFGLGDYKAYLLGILAMFPDLTYEIEDLQWMGNDDEGYTAAVRWKILGTHLGHGPYGAPTGRPVHMWGMSHLRVQDGLIVEEWTQSNEFEVLVQIAPDPVGTPSGPPVVSPGPEMTGLG